MKKLLYDLSLVSLVLEIESIDRIQKAMVQRLKMNQTQLPDGTLQQSARTLQN